MEGSGSSQRSVRVLAFMDQPLLLQVIRLTLNHGEFQAHQVNTTETALAAIEHWQPDVAVLDMDLEVDKIMEELATDDPTHPLRIPVLGLSRRGDLQSKLKAFERGVDDLMIVPFSPEEMLARVLVIVRRVYGIVLTLKPRLVLGDLEIDISTRIARVGDEEFHLTSVEQSLLYLLAANAGRAVSRDEILDTLWGIDYSAESNVVDRHVRNLRIKLQNNWRKPRFIATVPGLGYKFAPNLSPD